jgi:hypothetical protein
LAADWTDDLRGDLNENFRKKCYVLIRSAYRKVKSNGDYESGWKEEKFTQRVEHYMEIEYSRKDKWMHMSFSRSPLTDSSRTHSLDKDPDESSKIDIRIDAWRGKKKEFFIECKRLNLDSEEGLYRKYCKKDGVQQFVDGEYAENFSYGVMLGYVVIEEFEEVVDKVREKIDDYENRLNTEDSLNEVKKENSMGKIKECVSKHQRSERMPDIELRHFFLEFA